MNTNRFRLRFNVYHNPFYLPYKRECYLIFSDKGSFLFVRNDENDLEVYRHAYKPTFELSFDNIDQYMSTREFIKAYSRNGNGTNSWYNGYGEKHRSEIDTIVQKYYDLIITKRYDLIQ